MDEEDIKRFDEKYNKDWTIVIANYGKFFEQLDTTVKAGSILSFYFFKKLMVNIIWFLMMVVALIKLLNMEKKMYI